MQEPMTAVLERLRAGDPSAANELFELAYERMHAMAWRSMRGQPQGRTLRPTMVANEAFIKLVSGRKEWADEQHFWSVVALAMRCIIQDHARTRRAAKHGGGARHESIEAADPADDGRWERLVEVEDALEKLAEQGERGERLVRVVELRFLVGLSVAETADRLGLSPRTVNLDWEMARAWLQRELSRQTASMLPEEAAT